MAPPGPRIRPLRTFILPGLFVGILFYQLWARRPQPIAPTDGRNVVSLSGPIMGTTFSVKAITPKEPTSTDTARIEAAVLEALERVNGAMSTWKPDSELSRFNRHDSTEPFPLSADTLAVIAAAQTISEASGGAFDVTIKPLVNLWKFGSDAAEWEAEPSNADLALALGSVGYDKLTVEAGTARKANPDLTVDLGAIAKGYAVDQVGEALEAAGLVEYLVEVGGEVRARGGNAAAQPWRVGVEMPDAMPGALSGVVALEDVSMATSGDYRNYYEDADGNRISHTIDARTGRPIQHTLASVSVIHESATMADGWATALNVLGPEEGLKLAEAQGLAVLMLVREAPGQFGERATRSFDAYRVTASDQR